MNKSGLIRRCHECGKELDRGARPTKKFCDEQCKNQHNNIRKFINSLLRSTFTVAAAASKTRLAESTVRSRIRKRGIETFILDRCIRIRRTDAKLLLE